MTPDTARGWTDSAICSATGSVRVVLIYSAYSIYRGVRLVLIYVALPLRESVRLILIYRPDHIYTVTSRGAARELSAADDDSAMTIARANQHDTEEHRGCR